jgi:diguanylate cyclase (GGDEF)-like protein
MPEMTTSTDQLSTTAEELAADGSVAPAVSPSTWNGPAVIDLDMPLPSVMRWRIGCATLVLAGAVLAVWFYSQRQMLGGIFALEGMLAAAALLIKGEMTLSRRARWQQPLARMYEILAAIDAGHAGIEELASLQGPLAPLAEKFGEVLRDLRRQKSTVAKLEREMRHRVASRTDALERKIGSLRQQATRDALTGLYNRRMMEDYLPTAIARCSATHTLSLLMIDVDNFKPLNDTLGHPAGDDLLRNISQIIRSTIREADLAFRCGGDEFVIVLDGIDAEGGKSVAERLIKLVDDLATTLHVPAAPRLSIGVATLADCLNRTAEELLATADKRLYSVKNHRQATRLRAV